jgi:hypothetical protein
MNRRAKMTAAKARQTQQKSEAGLVSELFPKVTTIAISMRYRQTGALKPLSRTVNFFPGSSAIFKVSCLCAECVEGRFDFTKIISEMLRTRKAVLKGKISCESCSAPECSDVEYSVAIEQVK